MSSYRVLVLALLCAAAPITARLAAAGPRLPRAAAAPAVWACGESLKVSPDAAPQAANSVWDAADSRIRLYGARQEYVGFQVVVRGTDVPLNNVEVRVSDLRSAGGQVLPASNVDLYWQHYLRVTVPSQNAIKDYVYLVPEGGVGEYPVQMVPLRDGKPGRQFSVPANRNQPVWVDVYVPETQAPGDYTGQAQVLVNGTPVSTLSLQLTVWKFTLPRETHYKTLLNSTPEQLRWAFGIKSESDPVYKSLEDQIFQMAHQHRVNFQPEWPEKISNTWGSRYRRYMDGSAFTQRAGAGVGQTLVTMGPGGGSANAVSSYCKSTLNWWKAQKFKADLVCYVWDEPDDSDVPEVANLARWVQQAVGDQIPCYLTTPYPDLLPAGVIDIWGEVPSAQVAARQAAGQRFWSVNQGYAGGPYVDTPGYAGRSQAWMGWKMKLDAWQFWNCIYWTDKYNIVDANGVRLPFSTIDANPQLYVTDTWNNPMTFDQTKKPQEQYPIRLNGDGVLFYPGAPIGLTEPLASFTLKSVRRGQQDYEYLWLAAQKAIPTDDVVNSVTPGPENWARDPEIWDQARLELGRRLDAATPGTPLPPAGGAVLYSDVLLPGWSATAYRAAYNLSATGAVKAGAQAISLAITGTDGYLQLAGPGVAVTGKKALKFSVHGGKTGRQQLRVRVLVNGALQPSLNLWSYGGAPAAGAWTEYMVPLASLKATKGSLTGVRFTAGTAQSQAFIDEVRVE